MMAMRLYRMIKTNHASNLSAHASRDTRVVLVILIKVHPDKKEVGLNHRDDNYCKLIKCMRERERV